MKPENRSGGKKVTGIYKEIKKNPQIRQPKPQNNDCCVTNI